MLYIYLVDPSQFKLEFRTSVLEWVANILGKSEMQIKKKRCDLFRSFLSILFEPRIRLHLTV